MIVIVDYHMGNVGSILNMLKKIRYQAIVSSDPSELLPASKIILPGVGAFDHAMQNLETLKLLPVLNQKVLNENTPILGICLGMQLLALRSEEGKKAGLGWIDAEVTRFKFSTDMKLPVPHMGWNRINIMQNHSILSGLNNESKFYFVHSYYFSCKDPDNILTQTEYGIPFTSAVVKNHILGVQFHPEKSHRYGMTLLKNFAEMRLP